MGADPTALTDSQIVSVKNLLLTVYGDYSVLVMHGWL